jgi:hypothetical protein
METKQEPIQIPEATTEKHTQYEYALGPIRGYVGDTITLKLSPEANRYLNRAMNLSNGEIDDIFRKALVMYTVALEAKRDGKAVGSAESADVLDVEFVGF